MGRKGFSDIFKNCILKKDCIIVRNELKRTVEFIKNTYSFDKLEDINVEELSDKTFLLTYHLYSSANEEDAYLKTTVSNKAESLCDIYNNAFEFESKIKNEFNITF